jgi:cell wall-associated NlpC family hydrolase
MIDLDRPGRIGMSGGQPRHVPKDGLGNLQRLSRRGMLAVLAGVALAGVAGPQAAAENRKGRRIVREARKHVGDRYVAGGTAPGGFDCSGFTYYVVLTAIRKDISPALQAQLRVGRRVPPRTRRPGDLIFFSLEGGSAVTHVAIVLSKDRVVHAMNPRDGVKISDINSPYYMNNIHSVRRL